MGALQGRDTGPPCSKNPARPVAKGGAPRAMFAGGKRPSPTESADETVAPYRRIPAERKAPFERGSARRAVGIVARSAKPPLLKGGGRAKRGRGDSTR